MNRKDYQQAFQKGLLFAVILIFIVLIGFHVIAATLISKAFGQMVMRGGIPHVRFMAIEFSLLSLVAGLSAAGKKRNIADSVLCGLIAGLGLGVITALFDLLLASLINFNIDVRAYLPELSSDKINFFLMNQGSRAILSHVVMAAAGGIIGALVLIASQQEAVKSFFGKMKAGYGKLADNFNERTSPQAKKVITVVFYLVLIAILFLLPSQWGSYWNFVFGMVGLYVIAGIGLNIIVGLSGQLVLGYAAFFAMGAYSMALLNAPEPHHIMLGFWPSLLVGVVMAVFAAILLGLPIMNLRGDYLAIVTLGFGEIIRILLKSDLLTNFTGGPRGIHDIQGPTIFGRPFSSDADYVYLIILCVGLSIFFYNRLQDSHVGRAWLAIKEDPIAAKASGINVQSYKLLALCVGAAFAGLAGGIFAARNRFTGPDDHSLAVSINMLSVVIVGGVNSIPGIILGAFALKGLPELLREIENYRLLFFGFLLIAMMLIRPNGLWPSSRPLIEKGKEDGFQSEKLKKRGEKDD